MPFGQVIGLDPSPSMLTRAESLKENGCNPNLKFILEAAESFSLNERFDRVIAIHSMHWVKDQERALMNIHEHLKTSGKIHFILAPSKEGLPFDRALKKTIKNFEGEFTGFVNPQQVYDVETYRKLLVKNGFHVDAIHYIYHESFQANKERLKGWLLQWQPYVKHLPSDKQTFFLDELVSNYLDEIGEKSGSSPVKWGEYVLIVEAHKV